MQLLRKPLLAAAAAAVLIGGGAWAASTYPHHLQIRLPDGQIAQVDYAGDVAPRVVLRPVAAPPAAIDPVMAIGFPGFGQIDRIFADMERQQAAMMQQAAAIEHEIATRGPALVNAGPHAANGNVNWTYVSSTSTSNGCTQTVEWTSPGAAAKDAQPQVIRTSSGNCDKAVKDAPVHDVAEVGPQPPAPVGKVI